MDIRKISRVGNSFSVTFKRSFIQSLGLREGDFVVIFLDKDQIIIRRLRDYIDKNLQLSIKMPGVDNA